MAAGVAAADTPGTVGSTCGRIDGTHAKWKDLRNETIHSHPRTLADPASLARHSELEPLLEGVAVGRPFVQRVDAPAFTPLQALGLPLKTQRS